MLVLGLAAVLLFGPIFIALPPLPLPQPLDPGSLPTSTAPSSSQLSAAPSKSHGLHQPPMTFPLFAAAVDWNRDAIVHSAVMTHEVAASSSEHWDIAQELVTAVALRQLPRLRRAHFNITRRTSGFLPPVSKDEVLIAVGEASPCNGSSTSCLVELASPVWDAETQSHVPVSASQMPPPRVDYQDEAFATLLASLRRGAMESATQAAHGSPREAPRVLPAGIIAQAASPEAKAEQRRQYAVRVLVPRTRSNAYRSCFAEDKCNGASGPCEWCGARLCCYSRSKNDHVLCRGSGGSWRHVCSTVPSGSAELRATLDALTHDIDEA